VLIDLRSLLALFIKLPGGHCLIHIGTEGGPHWVALDQIVPAYIDGDEIRLEAEKFSLEQLKGVVRIVALDAGIDDLVSLSSCARIE